MRFRRYIAIRFVLAAVVLLASAGVFFFSTNRTAARENSLCDTDERVFDYGEYISAEEERELASQIGVWERNCRTDLVLYTDAEYISDSEVVSRVQQFLIDHDFGWDRSNGDTVLLYFNMSTRYVYVCTAGRAIGIFNSQRIYDKIVELVGDEAKEGNYYQGFYNGLSRIRWHMLMGKYVPAPILYFLIWIIGTLGSSGVFLARQTRNLARVPVDINDYRVSSRVLSNRAATISTHVIHHPRSSGGGHGGHGGGGGFSGGGGGGHSFGGGGGHF